MKTPRWLVILAFASAISGASCVAEDDTPGAVDLSRASTKDLINAAVEAGGNDEGLKAIGLVERALKGAPGNRDALYLLGVLGSAQANETKEPAAKVALLRKSTGAFAQLQKLYPTLTAMESDLVSRSRLDDPRALALEGKAEDALAGILGLLASGFEDLDAILGDPDLEPVRKLPQFATEFDRAVKAGVVEALARSRSFPFDFHLKDVDDKAVNLADYRGKVTIVDLWGTWCPPCRQEIPILVDLHKTYQPRGLEIVGINCNEEGPPEEVRKTIKDFAAAKKVEYKCLLNDGKTEAKIPEFRGYPTTLFLDRSGKVRLAISGSAPRARLEAVVVALLAEEGKP